MVGFYRVSDDDDGVCQHFVSASLFVLYVLDRSVFAYDLSGLYDQSGGYRHLVDDGYQTFSSLAVRLLAKLHIVKDMDKTLNSWSHQLQAFTQEIQKLKNEKKLIVKTVCINILRLTLLYALPFVIARAIGIPLPLHKLLDVIALSSFVSMANAFIPIPGASGGTEAVFVLLFSAMVGGTQASSIMILWRASTYHLVMLIGAGVFIWCRHHYSKKTADRMRKQEDIL